MKRPVYSQQQKQHIDLLQLNDDENADHQTDVEHEEQQQQQEKVLPPIKNDPGKTRQIRQLQNRLSRQEEEARKQLSDLQSKQSRLENALKLLTKQGSPPGKRRSQNPSDNNPSGNTPFFSLESILSLSLSCSHVETRPPRSYSGVWRPDTSTVHRLQGN